MIRIGGPLAIVLAGALAGCGPGPWVVALLGGSSASRDSSSESPPNASPALSLGTPARAQTGGRAEVGFAVSDADGGEVTLSFAFSVNGAAFAPALAAPGGVSNPAVVAAGTESTFVWDTAAQGVTNSGDVLVSVTAADSRGAAVAATTGRFQVVNLPLRLDLSSLAPGLGGRPALPPAEALGPGNSGPAYAFDLAPLVADGLGPYRFAARFSPALPGLALDPAAGRLAGTPTRSGTYEITIEADDVALGHAETVTALVVIPAVRIAARAIPPATPAAPYEERIAIRGGEPPYDVTVASGALPAGLALDPATGLVTGTAPSGATLTTFEVEARDARGFVTRGPVTLRVADAPRPLPPATPLTPPSDGVVRLALADLDGDGLDDLLRARVEFDMQSGQVILDAFLSTPWAAFSTGVAFAAPAIEGGAVALATGSFDGDGLPDLAIAVGEPGGGFSLHLLVRSGDPLTLTHTAAPLPLPSLPGVSMVTAIAVGRFGGGTDGVAVAMLSFTASGPESAVFLVPDGGAPAPAVVAGPTVAADSGLVAGDLDGDGVAEIHFGGTIYEFDPVGGAFVPALALQGPAARIDERLSHAEVVVTLDPLGPVLVRQVDPGDGSRWLEVDLVDLATPTVTAIASAPITGPPLTLLAPLPTATAGGALRLVAGDRGGNIYLVTVTAGLPIEPPAIGPDSVAQGGGLVPLLGAIRLAGGGSGIALAGGSGWGGGFDRSQVLTPLGGRLDGPDARTLSRHNHPLTPQPRFVPLRGGPRPEIVFVAGSETSSDVVVLATDAGGRLEPEEMLRTGGEDEATLSVAFPRLGAAVFAAILVTQEGLEQVAQRIELYGPLPLPPGPLPSASAASVALPTDLTLTIDAGDLDGDGRDEILLVELTTGFASGVAIDETAAGLEARPLPAAFVGAASLRFYPVDLDRDGALDLLFPPSTAANAAVAVRGRGDGSFDPATVEPVGGVVLAYGPVDDAEDDGPDVLVVGAESLLSDHPDRARLARNRDGLLGPFEELSDTVGASGIALVDADLDGALDAWIFGVDGLVVLLQGDGQGGFVEGPRLDVWLIGVPFRYAQLHAADLDADGIDDLVILNGVGTLVTLFGDGRGGLRRAIEPPE